LETNLGDPGLFPGVADLEQQVVIMLGELLGCINVAGYISSGGTESNIQAIRAARNEAGKKNGNIVVPASAHFSFDKIGTCSALRCARPSWTRVSRPTWDRWSLWSTGNTVALVGMSRNH